jgi:hypothetical protein
MLIDDPRHVCYRSDPLSQLNLCEDDGDYRLRITPRTVVFSGLFGSDNYVEKIVPVIEKVSARIVDLGLHDEGIAVTLASRRQALLTRLFYKGSTIIQ